MMNMTTSKNIAIGIIIGIGAFLLFGFRYSVGTGTIDVRLVNVGGHEYVVSTITSGVATGGNGISTVHHVGCSACRGIVK